MLELCKEKEKVLQMLNTVIFNGEVYSAPNSALNSKDKNLNMVKLKKLLYNLGFKLTSIGTIFILEELAFFFNNGLDGFYLFKEAYNISAQIHNVELKNVQWAIESAISSILRFSNIEILKEIFFWYTPNEIITPREFISTMILYLEERKKEYNNNM